MTPDPREAYVVRLTPVARRTPYRHESHIITSPTRGQLIGRRIAGVALGAVLALGLGLAGSSDLQTACKDANPATSSACITP